MSGLSVPFRVDERAGSTRTGAGVRLCCFLLSERGQQQMHCYCHNVLSTKEELPGGFIIVPRYMCPPLHLALWGLMGPSQGCTLHRRLYAPPPAPQSPWFERSGGFGRPRAPHGGALRATFRTRICSFRAYRGCKSVVTDLMTHAHGLVRLPAARITRETFNCSNPCTERGKMGAECKGDQISAYRCNVR